MTGCVCVQICGYMSKLKRSTFSWERELRFLNWFVRICQVWNKSFNKMEPNCQTHQMCIESSTLHQILAQMWRNTSQSMEIQSYWENQSKILSFAGLKSRGLAKLLQIVSFVIFNFELAQNRQKCVRGTSRDFAGFRGGPDFEGFCVRGSSRDFAGVRGKPKITKKTMSVAWCWHSVHFFPFE